MGAPASPSFANLIMEEIFCYVVETLKFYIPLIKFFVDDTLLLVPYDKIQYILDVFNSYHQKIQFTIEVEKDNSLPFLDLLIIRENSSIITDWYTKAISTNRCINFYSSHSMQQKTNIMENLIKRALKLSNKKFHRKNLDKVENILKQNNYPTYLVKRIINKHTSNRSHIVNVPSNSSISSYFRFPYLPGLSHRINKIFKELNVKCAFYNLFTTKRFFTNLKFKTPYNLESGVVYKIPCANCNKCYIGQTKQYLRDRMKQHKYDSENIANFNKTALTLHQMTTGHKFNFEDVKILDREEVGYRRNISEMIHIKRNYTVNHREDVQHLSMIYNNILRK
ncbi:uncharacterized protein LOC123316054 [Coccinella septempunctata]|uniref:uncharacterized protein LOC123316054 n=1 Tax=Coccinella septempunctata TaxID=41139 RepID=UPI001D07E025|nr:uncharacterized protein LOC123316054 [Coccinella septempunctata]